jgi:predicted metal-dependent hydrolase
MNISRHVTKMFVSKVYSMMLAFPTKTAWHLLHMLHQEHDTKKVNMWQQQRQWEKLETGSFPVASGVHCITSQY